MKLLDGLLTCIYLCVCIVRFVEYTYFLSKFGSFPVEIFYSSTNALFNPLRYSETPYLGPAYRRFTTVALSPIMLFYSVLSPHLVAERWSVTEEE